MRLWQNAQRLVTVGLITGGLLLVGVGAAYASSRCTYAGSTTYACITSTPSAGAGLQASDYVDASSNLTISYGAGTTFPITAGDQNIVIDVQGASPGSTPHIFGEDSSTPTPVVFDTYTGVFAQPPGDAAYCTTANASGDATCYISVPQNAVMPVTFFVTDSVSLPSNQIPEVPYAAGLPFLLTLALPLRRWMKNRRGASAA